MKLIATLLPLCALAWPLQLAAAARTGWIGTYTSANGANTGSAGIYAFQWDDARGSLEGLHVAAATSNPSFLAVHPSGRFLYAVNEDSSHSGTDSITAFAILHPESSPALRAIGTVPSQGLAPCHLLVDPSGKWLFVANYSSGTLAVYPVQPDGRLAPAIQTVQQHGSGPFPGRQESAHAHEVVLSPEGRFLLSVDLGADRIFVYRFDASTGRLTPNTEPAFSVHPGLGPRHLVFAKDGRTIYVMTELEPAVLTLRWNPERGSMALLGTVSTLPPGQTDEHGGAEIVLHPNGQFLYASNRGHSNTLAIFRIGPDGLPVPTGHVSSGGEMPRFFAIDPSGKFLLAANQGSGNVVVWRIDPASGALQRVGPVVSVPAPTSFVFAPNR
jgi:6-phosphogluconolactonase